MATIAPAGKAISGTAFAALWLIALMMGANHVAARITFNNGVDAGTAVVFRSVITALVIVGFLALQQASQMHAADDRAADRRSKSVPVFGRGAAAGGAGA